jgi:formylglycine-generating enzyme required for sulfatase activity
MRVLVLLVGLHAFNLVYPQEFRDCPVCPRMVMLPAGEVAMGVAPGEEEREQLAPEFRHRSEPQRTVRIARVSVGRFEVTRGEYRVFAEATRRESNGCFAWSGTDFMLDAARSWRNTGYPQTDDHPAACVSWEDAQAYVEWLSRLTGHRYRLPSEAEWEYAARAGTATPRYWSGGPDAACLYANGADRAARTGDPHAHAWGAADCDDGHAYTAPVGRYRANAFGLNDMLGNVGEWTADCWNADYRAAPADGRARTDGDCRLRAVRGGAWDDAPVGLRAAYRVGSPVVVRLYSRGFRVAREE